MSDFGSSSRSSSRNLLTLPAESSVHSRDQAVREDLSQSRNRFSDFDANSLDRGATTPVHSPLTDNSQKHFGLSVDLESPSGPDFDDDDMLNRYIPRGNDRSPLRSMSDGFDRQKRPTERIGHESPQSKKSRRGGGNPFVSPYNGDHVDRNNHSNHNEGDDQSSSIESASIAESPDGKRTIETRNGTCNLFDPAEQFECTGDGFFYCLLCKKEDKPKQEVSTSATSQIKHVKEWHHGWHIRKPDAIAMKTLISGIVGTGKDNGEDGNEQVEHQKGEVEECVTAPDFSITSQILELYRHKDEKVKPYVIFFQPLVDRCNGDAEKFDEALQNRVVWTSPELFIEQEPELVFYSNWQSGGCEMAMPSF